MAEKPVKLDEETMETVTGGKYSGSVFLYTIQPGDNLTTLAHRFGTTVGVIGELNDIRSAGSIRPGDRILIPLRA